MLSTKDAVVQNITESENRIVVTLILNLEGDADFSDPMAPAEIWREKSGSRFKFELHRFISSNGKIYIFESYDTAQQLPQINEQYNFSTLRWPEHLEAARSEVADWCFQKFKSRDSIRYSPGEQVGETVPGGWDHEHCFFCQRTICDAEDGHAQSGYVNKGDNWLCTACFEKYIRSGFGKRLG